MFNSNNIKNNFNHNIRKLQYIDGRSKGVSVIEINTGKGLVFEILPDRGLDIYRFSLYGQNLTYLVPGSPFSSSHYDSNGYGWLNTFNGGFLVTCGLRNAGEPCVENKFQYGLHGTISNTPASEVKIDEISTTSKNIISVSGKIIDPNISLGNLLLERRIECAIGENIIKLNDSITNFSNFSQPIMLIYHFNFGYPLLSSSSFVGIPEGTTEPFDKYSKKMLPNVNKVREASNKEKEYTFIHKPKTKKQKQFFLITDSKNKPSMAIKIQYSGNKLPILGLNQIYKSNEYLLSIEPANNHIKGRVFEKNNGTLFFLEEGQKISYQTEIEILISKKNILKYIDKFK